MTQSFELEKALRTIDSCENIEELKSLCKTLAQGWFSQKAATQWVMKQNLSNPPITKKLN